MFTALDENGQEAVSLEVSRAGNYYCPVCGEVLVFKAGAIVIPHFAHQPNSRCKYGVGESARHREMKVQIGKIFAAGNVRYEVPMDERRVDLLVKIGKLEFVVECQHTALSLAEWEWRTTADNRRGYPVLWVWDLARIIPGVANVFSLRSMPEYCIEGERRMPAEIRHCHRRSYGRVYVLDKDGALYSCHLDAAGERWREGGPTWDESSYTPRTLKECRFHATPLRPWAYRGPEDDLLIQLGEGVWWKE